MTGAREMRTLAPGWKSLDDLVCWVHTLLPEREERERPEEVRGIHFSCLLPPETRRPSGPKEEEVRLPLLASMVVGVGVLVDFIWRVQIAHNFFFYFL